MLPDNKLSTLPVEGAYLYDMGVDVTPVLDYKPGGIRLNDPSMGMDFQIWRGRLVNPGSNNSKIILDGRFTPEHEFLSFPYMVEFNFTFDFNMSPMAVFITEEEIDGTIIKNCFIHWYDTTLERFDTVFLGDVIRTPKLLMDDPRESDKGLYFNTDICLFYWESGNLYVRYMKDRFTERYLLKRNVPYIHRVGMNDNFRLQFEMVRETDQC